MRCVSKVGEPVCLIVQTRDRPPESPRARERAFPHGASSESEAQADQRPEPLPRSPPLSVNGFWPSTANFLTVWDPKRIVQEAQRLSPRIYPVFCGLPPSVTLPCGGSRRCHRFPQ